MTKFGLICPPGVGHLNNFMALGYELQKRGHQATLFGISDVESYATAAKINFCPIGKDKFPLGSNKRSQERLGKLSGIPALFYTIDLFRTGTEMLLESAPQACKRSGIEVLLIDQVLLEGSTIAEYLNLPFVTVCSAILLNPEQTVPPTLTSWNYDPFWWGQLRNQIGSSLLELAGTPIKLIVNQYRQKWRLGTLKVDNFVMVVFGEQLELS